MEFTQEQKEQLIQLALQDKIKSARDFVTYGFMRQEEYDTNLKNLEEYLKPKSNNSNYNQLLICIGGGPMSGKTTLRNVLFHETDFEAASVQLRSDTVKRFMPEYLIIRNLIDDPTLHLSEDESQRLKKVYYDFLLPKMLEATEIFTKYGKPIIIDAHMHDVAEVKAILNVAKKHGYSTLLLAPDIDVPVFFDRGKRRLEQTGKRFMVPESLMHHQLFEQNWAAYQDMFDVACRLDNNTHNGIPFVSAFSIDGKITICNGEAYERARRKIGINYDGKSSEEVLPSSISSEQNVVGLSERMGEGEAASGPATFTGQVGSENSNRTLKFLEEHRARLSRPMQER